MSHFSTDLSLKQPLSTPPVLFNNILLTYDSGPAKGYIEGLEHRLHEAETLLLQVLPLIPSDQLASAASAANDVSQHGVSRDSPDRPNNNRSSPPVLNKKTGIDYWENFPLDSVDNIRRWQADCALHSNFKEENSHRSGSSRPNSVDVSDQLTTRGNHSRKSSSSTAQQYRSMSNDTFHGGSQDYKYNGITPSRYSGAPPNTTTFGLQTQPAYASEPTQQWSQQNGMSNRMASHPAMHHHHPHQQQSPPQIVAAGGPMDVDSNGGFFSGEVKRHLFW